MTGGFPPEIYAIICNEVQGTGELAALCSTSRLLRDLVQHILYRSVDLTDCSLRTIKSWALSVSRNPHLAACVQSLAIRFPEGILDPADATKITVALKKCVNLKDLEVACARSTPSCTSKHVWMIEDCPFRLRTFRNSYFTTSQTWMTKFWEAQTEIRVLAFRRGGRVPTLEYLPNLLAVRVPHPTHLPPDRPLQRVYTTLVNDLAPLARYRQSLKTVILKKTWGSRDCLTFLRAIELLADSLPLLCHLWFVEGSKSLRGAGADCERAPTAALQRFNHLEDFVLHTRNVSSFKEDSDSLYLMTEPAGLEALGSAIMAACPTLRRVNLGGEIARDVELTCVLTRSATGGIHIDHGTEFDSDACSMFW